MRGHASFHALRKPLFAPFFLVALLFPVRAGAAAPAYSLGEIKVTAGALDFYYFTPLAASEISLTPETSNRSLSDLLNLLPGFRVTHYGVSGGFSTLSIRGSSPAQVLVLWNGVPLNLASTGVVNLSDLPMAGVERVQVFRGFAPADTGGSAMGGVVNLVSKGFDQKFSYHASYGSFATNKESVFVPLKRMWIAAATEGSSGRFHFNSDHGTPYNPADDFVDTRRNNGTRAAEVILRGSARLKSSDLIYESDAYGRDQGLPGIYSNQATLARWHTGRWLSSVTLRRPTPTRLMSSTLYFHHQREKFLDPKGEAGLLPQDNLYTTDALGANLLYTSAPGRRQSWTTSVNLRDESFDSDRRIQGITDPTRRRTLAAVNIEDAIQRAGGQWSLGVTAEAVRNRFDTTTRDAWFSWHAGYLRALSPRVSFKANVGVQNRKPSFSELFGDRGFVVGNPALRPERSLNFDAGLVKWSKRALLQATVFASWPQDLILFVQNSQYTVKPFNIERARIFGLEFGGSYTVARLRGSVEYTFQRAEDTSATFYRGNPLPGRPRQQLNLRLERPSRYGSPFYEFDFTGHNYLDRANRVLNKGVRSHNLGLSGSRGSARWTLEVRNLFNALSSDVLAFPLPGRSFSLTYSR